MCNANGARRCGYRITVLPQVSNLLTGVRLPLPAHLKVSLLADADDLAAMDGNFFQWVLDCFLAQLEAATFNQPPRFDLAFHGAGRDNDIERRKFFAAARGTELQFRQIGWHLAA